LGNLKLLDSLIAGIGNIQVVMAVERHSMRMSEFARFTSRATKPKQKLPVCCETLNSIVQTADPDSVVAIDGNSNGAKCVLQRTECIGAESAVLVALISPGKQRLPILAELLNSAENSLGCVIPPLSIGRQKMRSAKP
jgi:hypothetical protein